MVCSALKLELRFWSRLSGIAGKERCTFVVVEERAARAEVGVNCLDDCKEREDEEDKGRPVDEGVVLVEEDGEECPCNDGGSGRVTGSSGECVSCSSRLEEDKGEEHKDLGPDTCLVVVCVDAKGLEGGNDDENNGPAVVEGEGEVDKELGCRAITRRVVAVDDVVDL